MSLDPAAAGAAPHPADEKIYQLIRSDWNVVVAAARNDAWVRSCMLFCPTAHYFVYADDAASQTALAAGLRPLGEAVVVAPRPLGRAGTEGVDTLDAQRAGRFHHLNYLRIERADAAMDVLMGARALLRYSRINLIEIAPSDAGVESLAPLAMVLERYNYVVMRLEGSAFKPLTHADLAASRWGGHTIAVHSRLLTSFTQDDYDILDLPALLGHFGITTRGVIHLGAHEAEELPTYLELGARPILLVEANPNLMDRLRSIAATTPGVVVAQCAVNDADGPIELRVATLDEASSILPFKTHAHVYPDVVESAVVTVDGARLDRLMDSLDLDPAEFNLLCIDIQGAELRALRGATRTLQSIQAVSVEINFEELYAGCAQVEDIDDFLGELGFDRVSTLTPYHSSWGDALYVRRNFAVARQ
ncbi:MAG: FkbM family methyltransferase [Alphaproteobacteria bacterium]|nr:FkbM family methyltransferase [Alphaproteobacteria bacterium]